MNTFWPTHPPAADTGRTPRIAWWSQRATDPAARPLAALGESADIDPVSQARDLLLLEPPIDRPRPRVLITFSDTRNEVRS